MNCFGSFTPGEPRLIRTTMPLTGPRWPTSPHTTSATPRCPPCVARNTASISPVSLSESSSPRSSCTLLSCSPSESARHCSSVTVRSRLTAGGGEGGEADRGMLTRFSGHSLGGHVRSQPSKAADARWTSAELTPKSLGSPNAPTGTAKTGLPLRKDEAPSPLGHTSRYPLFLAINRFRALGQSVHFIGSTPEPLQPRVRRHRWCAQSAA
jgi:hypothetical protein